jgi:hypothetical protein
MVTPLKTRTFNNNNVSVVEERERKEDYNSSVTSSSTGGSNFRREHANHHLSYTIQDDSDDNNREEKVSDDQMPVMIDPMVRGNNLGLDPPTTSSSVLSSICDQQTGQERRKPKSRRQRRKKNKARNVPKTEPNFVSAGPGNYPPVTSSPAKFTLSQPVNSSRVRPVDATSTSVAATTTSAGETSPNTASSPSTTATTTQNTTQTTTHGNHSRIAMKRSFAVLEKRMAHRHFEMPSGKENAGASETENRSSFHTPNKAPQDKPTNTIRERPSGKENGALLGRDKLSSFHTPPSTTPAKEPQDEDNVPGSVNTDTSLDNSNSGEDGEVKVKVVRFADEVGKPLEAFHSIGGKDDPHATGRIIIMLLSPQERKFEFIHAEFLLREKTTVTDVLYQVPKIATNELFQSQTFTNICRTRHGNTDLDNDRILQDYDMDDSELVLGVLEGFSGKEMAQCALPLLLNGRITQAVSKACSVLCYSKEILYRVTNMKLL